MDKQKLGGGLLAAASILAAFLLPVTFPELTGLGLDLAWLATALAFSGGLWLIWHKPSPHEPKPDAVWNTLRHYFDNDFGLLKLNCELTMTKVDGSSAVIPFQIHRNFDSHSDFVSAYVPREGDEGYIRALASAVQQRYDQMVSGLQITVSQPGDARATRSDSMTFTRRVYVYHECHLEPRQVADLIDAYAAQNLDLQLRGTAYAVAMNMSGRLVGVEPLTA